MNPFRSFRDYEEFIYTLSQRFPAIERSTLVVKRRGRCTALLQGELMFTNGFRLVVLERLSHDGGRIQIESYGYELWQNTDKLGWYDSQPHPDEPTLVSTHPHHKHILPDIKRHRIPAPEMSFEHPNLSALIQEIERLIRDREC